MSPFTPVQVKTGFIKIGDSSKLLIRNNNFLFIVSVQKSKYDNILLPSIEPQIKISVGHPLLFSVFHHLFHFCADIDSSFL